jgi:hypothetical protein
VAVRREHTNHCAGAAQATQSFRQFPSRGRAWPETMRALQYHRAKILRMDKPAQNRFNCPSERSTKFLVPEYGTSNGSRHG